MRNRLESILRAVSLGLAVLLVFQLVFMAVRRNPLTGLKPPVPPHWQAAEESAPTPGGTFSPRAPTSGPPATVAMGTNLPTTTNLASIASPVSGTNGTNISALSTNVVANLSRTNSTNIGNAQPLSTNWVVTNGSIGSNAVAISSAGTNSSATNSVVSTNSLAGTNSLTTTNLTAASRPFTTGKGPPADAPGGPPGRRVVRPARPLSPLTQARVDRITQSEILAPVFRPPPMALLGIAGRDAFIRTPNGQATLLREGGESDGIKLLRLGTNRVLIEQGGEKKELTIFDGFGSESLLSK